MTYFELLFWLICIFDVFLYAFSGKARFAYPWYLRYLPLSGFYIYYKVKNETKTNK